MTTRPRPDLPRSGPAGAALLAAVLLAAVLAGCSTARERDTPEAPSSLLHYRDAKTEAYFQHVYRSGNLYVDFRPALVVDAIVEDRTYRRLYVEMLGRQFLLPAAEVARRLAEQEQAFETEFALLVFTYEGTTDPARLARSDARWKLLLRDDDGQLLAPTAITPIRKDSPTYLYIDTYFSGLDRWSRAYEVTFPKLSKGRLNQPVGTHPFELIVTGVKGTVTLKWEHPQIFYAVTESGK